MNYPIPDWATYTAEMVLKDGYIVRGNGSTAAEAKEKLLKSLHGRDVLRSRVVLTEQWQEEREKIEKREKKIGSRDVVILGYFGDSDDPTYRQY